MGGYLGPLIDRALLKNAASGTSEGVDVAGCSALAFYVAGSTGVSAGAVTLEESHDKDFTGTWAPIGTAVTVIVGVAVPVRINGAVKAVRARITTPVTGGTGVTVTVVGA